jgi:hypothetical protein
LNCFGPLQTIPGCITLFWAHSDHFGPVQVILEQNKPFPNHFRAIYANRDSAFEKNPTFLWPVQYSIGSKNVQYTEIDLVQLFKPRVRFKSFKTGIKQLKRGPFHGNNW